MVDRYTKLQIPDYQMSVFLMAIYLNGMTTEETAALTEAMLHSGLVVDLSEIPGLKIDKHSTGGVGDKTSLILAPIVAAAGVAVPMISGRGLGHTGGTLDKLDAIPGFKTSLPLEDYKRIIRETGLVLVGQTEEIAPADKKLYALRDVTATVESIPLITGSIMSKKLAEGIDGLVLDVKTGSGAFMKAYEDSIALAESLINTAKACDKKVIGFITDMSQPLGNYIGNWLEIIEVVKILKGEPGGNLLEVSLWLAGGMLFLAGKADSVEAGKTLAQKYIDNGEAYKKFEEVVTAQGGDVSYLRNPDSYPAPKYYSQYLAKKEGYLSAVDTYQIGMAGLELGAGRFTKDDSIDFKAGIIFYPKIGEYVKAGQVIADLYTDIQDKLSLAEKRFDQALQFGEHKPEVPALIRKIIL
jgi:pyrimidine-nucleoside phosphorylase